MAWLSVEWYQGLCMTDWQKGEYSKGYKMKDLISSLWGDDGSDAAPDTPLWIWINFWNCWTSLGFCSPCFSLLQSYFCSVVSGGHIAICVFTTTCSCIPVGESSKGDEPGEVGGSVTRAVCWPLACRTNMSKPFQLAPGEQLRWRTDVGVLHSVELV